MKTLTDTQLISRYLQAHDQLALEELVRRYLPLVFGYVRKFIGDAEAAADITQEVFVKVWKNFNRLDENKSFRSWLFTIAKNTALDWLKQKKALPFSVLEQNSDITFSEQIIDDAPSILDQLADRQRANVLYGALGQLPLAYTSVLNLRLTDDLTFKQIATTLRRPLNTVKSQYRRGVTLLKQAMRS